MAPVYYFIAALLGGIVALSDAQSSNTNCCQLLSQKNLSVSSATPNAQAELFWSAQAATLIPDCVVRPKSTEEVSSVVSTLAGANCTFAVRGGGHTPWANASSIGSGGVLVNLGALNNVTYQGKTTVVGAGARWGDVYAVLDPMNVTVAGGRATHVGVAGLLTGGGNSFLAGRYGMACDTVGRYTVVLGNGTVYSVFQQNHSDLYKALKGGSNNFGIVTEFELYNVKQEPFWGGTTFYDPRLYTKKNIELFQKFTENIQNEPNGSLISIWIFKSPLGNQRLLWNVYDYLGEYVDASYAQKVLPKPFREFAFLKQLPNMTTTRVSNMSNFTAELNLDSGPRYTFATLTFNNSIDVIQKVYDTVEQNFNATEIAQEGTYNISTFSIQIQPLPAVFAKNGMETGGNSLGLERNEQNLVIFLLEMSWIDPKYDRVMSDLNEKILKDIKQAIPNDLNEFIYLNYALPTQEPIKGYGASNVAKLVRVANEYDPNGVFQKNVPGGFKLPMNMAR